MPRSYSLLSVGLGYEIVVPIFFSLRTISICVTRSDTFVFGLFVEDSSHGKSRMETAVLIHPRDLLTDAKSDFYIVLSPSSTCLRLCRVMGYSVTLSILFAASVSIVKFSFWVVFIPKHLSLLGPWFTVPSFKIVNKFCLDWESPSLNMTSSDCFCHLALAFTRPFAAFSSSQR